MENKSNIFKISILFLAALDLIVWYFIFSPAALSGPELYFLKVGQGDSSLAVLSGGGGSGVKFLIDGGPLGGGLGTNLDKIFRANDRYVDLIFISHPQIDHFGGLLDILKNYEVGAVLYNGEDSNDANWKELNKIISDKNIVKIALAAGDEVVYASSTVKILNSSGFSANANDSGLALLLESGGLKALYTADLSADAERAIVRDGNIQADVLKVSHHGSKYSSDLTFLEEVKPKISVIEVGKNSYGHPTKEALSRLAEIGSQVFRTDLQGIIKVINNGGKIKVFNINF
jgi:competence protein ComEC